MPQHTEQVSWGFHCRIMPRGIYPIEKRKGLFQKGHPPTKGSFQKGHPSYLTEKSKRKMSENSARFWKGKKLSEEHKLKLSLVKRGKPGNAKGKHWKMSERDKMNLSKRLKGISKPPQTEEHKRKISKNRKGKCVGAQHPHWNNGSSFEPYSLDWTKTLKQNIRERDKYTCQLCGQFGNVVHHIDYNKKNCNLENLITLCVSCHTKVNFNRDYWTNYFQKMTSKNKMSREIDSKCWEIMEFNPLWQAEVVKYLKRCGFSDDDVYTILDRYSEGKSFYPYLDR